MHPGLAAARPDIVDRLASYQHFGHTGNWLPILAKLTNENKHNQLTPQVSKAYKFVTIRVRLAAGETTEIDLKKIRLGGNANAAYQAAGPGTWNGLEFADTGVVVLPLLEGALVSGVESRGGGVVNPVGSVRLASPGRIVYAAWRTTVRTQHTLGAVQG